MAELYAVGGKVIGPSHANSGADCEDSFIFDFSADREWCWGIVSDGCGSASRAKEGAEFLTQKLIAPLGELAADISRRGPGDWVIDEVVVTIANLRKSMRAEFRNQILDYSATLVAVVCSSSGGFFIHLGDGIGLALGQSGEPAEGYLREVARTNPENGEYVNETFYLTESNWLHHLRISPFGKWDLLLLCTDGAQDLLFNGIVAEPGPIESLISSLSFSRPDDEAVIERFFGHPLAQSKSGDDKTCLILAHKDLFSRGIKQWKLFHDQRDLQKSRDRTETIIEPRIEKYISHYGGFSAWKDKNLESKKWFGFKIKKIYNYLIMTFLVLLAASIALWIWIAYNEDIGRFLRNEIISNETKIKHNSEKEILSDTEIKSKEKTEKKNSNSKDALSNRSNTGGKVIQNVDQKNNPINKENQKNN